MRPSVAPGYADILGQSRVCQQLWAAVSADHLHHCYLFEGPQGVGKATVALRLAMAANCEGDAPVAPCGTCGPCRLIAEGRHPDVIEVGPDPAKASEMISVEQVREIIRVFGLHRHSARRRLVILDPMDLVGGSATNALLKTLEEPPAGSGFILITSRLRSLLPTVVSRALRIRFRAVPAEDLIPWLRSKGIQDAERMARLSFGSPGLALTMSESRAEELALSRTDLLRALSGDPKALFDYADALAAPPRSAFEPRVERMLESLEILLRDAVNQASGREDKLIEPEVADLTLRWSRVLWPGGVVRVESALAEARNRLRLNVNARLVVEALLACLVAELGPAAYGGGR
jgi:DNA polymerase III subunit delta'